MGAVGNRDPRAVRPPPPSRPAGRALASHRPLRPRRRLSRGARRHPHPHRGRGERAWPDVALRRHRPALRSRSRRQRRPRMDRKERNADRRHDRLVRLHRDVAHLARKRHGRGERRRPLRQLHALPRVLPDERNPPRSHRGQRALHQLRDHRAPRSPPCRPPGSPATPLAATSARRSAPGTQRRQRHTRRSPLASPTAPRL